MKRTLWLSLSLLVCVCFAPAARAQGQTGVVVVDGGTLIDGNGGAPVRDVVMVIRGNRIESISSRGQAQIPAGATVLRADGKFIIPGLMDAHVHYPEWGSEMFPAFGVTSVFEIGGGGSWGILQREAINRGKIPGPRLFLAVGSIAGAAIAAVSASAGAEGPLSGRQVIGSAADARKVVQRFIDERADMIKVHRGPPLEVYKAAIEEAHKMNLPVVAQPIGPTVFAREAVLAGADILEHAAGVGYAIVKDPSKWSDFGNIEVHSIDPTPFIDMDESKATELIRLMVDRNVYLEPDFIAVARGFHKNRLEYELQDYRVFSQHGLMYVPASRKLKILGVFREFDRYEQAAWERREKGYHNMLRFMKRFVDAGGKVMTGTDTPGWAVPGIGLHHELDILVREVGMTPMQAILAGTRNVAEGFRILERLGTLEAGKLADLMIVDADPLADINNLQKIAWVVKDGKVVDRTFHPWYQNPIPRGEIEQRGWLASVKRQTLQRDPTWAFGQPPPGIEAISPNLVTEGNPALTLHIRGINFTDLSVVYVDGEPVPTEFVKDTELKANIEASMVAHAGARVVTVRNPEPVQRDEWGDGGSNEAYLRVNFRY